MFDVLANEADVREDLIVPFLKELGYSRGSSNNIVRELCLKYSKEQLGRQKPSDPTLRGIPDYMLSVTASGRWVLEIKRPSSPLDASAIGQALSYAKHPEISATYAVVTNGNRLKIFAAHQTAVDKPVLECAVTSPSDLAMAVTGYLSPPAIRRVCKLSPVGDGAPLARGLGNCSGIRRGNLLYENNTYSIAEGVPREVADPLHIDLADRMQFMNGLKSNILGGTIIRDTNSRIVAKLEFGTDREELALFAAQNGLVDVEYICLDNYISTDPNSPSTFDITGGFAINAGETIYDVVRRETFLLDVPCSTSYSGHAVGVLADDRFSGTFAISYEFNRSTPFLDIPYNVYSRGSFTLLLE